MNLQTAIRRLESKLGTVVNLEVLHPAFAEIEELQLAPDQYHHHGDYCRWTKKQPNGISACSANKARSRKIAARGKAFWGFCPKGIWDYAQPVLLENELVAIVYIGYLLPPGTELPSGWSGRQPGVLSRERRREIGTCADFLARFVSLELEQYAESSSRHGKKREETFYMEQCRHFIGRLYHLNPALADLAEMLHVNVNYLGGVIRKTSGKSFRELLTERRIQESEHLLRFFNHKYNISEIGYKCGFLDSNYFCTVFKKWVGLSPREYIRQCEPGKVEEERKID